jgi:hypothetical protein
MVSLDSKHNVGVIWASNLPYRNTWYSKGVRKEITEYPTIHEISTCSVKSMERGKKWEDFYEHKAFI